MKQVQTHVLVHVWRCCRNVSDASVVVTRHRTAAWNVIVSLCLLRIVKKMVHLLPNIDGFGGIPELEAYQIKNEYAQRRRLRHNKFTSKSEVYPTWAPLPNPKEMKASLSKIQSFKFILQNAASKLRVSKLQSSNSIFYIQSPLFFCQLVQLQVFKNLLKKSKIIFHHF